MVTRVLIFLLSTTLFATPIATERITVGRHIDAQVYLPPSLDWSQPLPLIIALHGIYQSPDTILPYWAAVADELGAILVCPKGQNYAKGYTRRPVDDRKLLADLHDYLNATYTIDPNYTLLAGFSKGGNFAIEAGILYPERFPNVLCLFGFMIDAFRPRLTRLTNTNRYTNSQFTLVTGNGDMTQTSLTTGHTLLQKQQVPSFLIVHPNVIHDYPPNLTTLVASILFE